MKPLYRPNRSEQLASERLTRPGNSQLWIRTCDVQQCPNLEVGYRRSLGSVAHLENPRAGCVVESEVPVAFAVERCRFPVEAEELATNPHRVVAVERRRFGLQQGVLHHLVGTPSGKPA
jgi:hypothetical protein